MLQKERVSRRPRRSEVAPNLTTKGPNDLNTRPYAPLAEHVPDLLVEAALELLATSGVAFEPGSRAIGYLSAGGCQVDTDGIVCMPRELVLKALQTSAKSVLLWNRDATSSISLDCHHTWFIPGMTCIKVFDLQTQESRNSTGEDLAMIARLADALPQIDAVCVACKNVSRSDIHGEIEEFVILAKNTSKPLEYLCEHAASLSVVIDIASEIRGGPELLREKPYFLHIVTPMPLNYHAAHSDQIINAVLAGIPLSVGTLPIGGASTPITTAGCMANSLATDFAAMVLAQIVKPGSFCIGSSDVCFMEPATGGIGNSAQTAMADMVMCQLRRRLDLPSFTGAAGYSSAAHFNQDAVAEISTSLMQAFYSRPATLDYLGSLDQGLTFSLHALMLCHDFAGLLRTLWAGVQIDDETLALALAKQVGPRGNYLAHRHTVSHCRENLWTSRYFGPNMPLSGDGKPELDLFARIDIDLKFVLSSRTPVPLDLDLEGRIDRICDDFIVTFGE